MAESQQEKLSQAQIAAQIQKATRPRFELLGPRPAPARPSVLTTDPLGRKVEEQQRALAEKLESQVSGERQDASRTHLMRTALYYVAIATMLLVLLILIEAWQRDANVFYILTDHVWAFTIFITAVVGGLMFIRYNAALGAGLIVIGFATALIAIVYTQLF